MAREYRLLMDLFTVAGCWFLLIGISGQHFFWFRLGHLATSTTSTSDFISCTWSIHNSTTSIRFSSHHLDISTSHICWTFCEMGYWILRTGSTGCGRCHCVLFPLFALTDRVLHCMTSCSLFVVICRFLLVHCDLTTMNYDWWCGLWSRRVLLTWNWTWCYCLIWYADVMYWHFCEYSFCVLNLGFLGGGVPFRIPSGMTSGDVILLAGGVITI